MNQAGITDVCMMDSVDVAMDVDVGKDGALVLLGAGEERVVSFGLFEMQGVQVGRKKDNESTLRVIFFSCLLLSFSFLFFSFRYRLSCHQGKRRDTTVK